jgi:hypothetical protein
MYAFTHRHERLSLNSMWEHIADEMSIAIATFKVISEGLASQIQLHQPGSSALSELGPSLAFFNVT